MSGDWGAGRGVPLEHADALDAGYRPRLLWIPHNGWRRLAGQRPTQLARHLADRFEIHVISWIQPAGRELVRLGAARSYWDPECPGLRVHEVVLAPNLYRLAVRGYPPAWCVLPNQVLFRRHILGVLRRWRFDVGIVASSHHFTGYPSLRLPFPWIFDYLDLSPPAVERAYCGCATAVVAASPALADRAARHGRPVVTVPNGLEGERYRGLDAAACRRRLGLEGRSVVSLIGLTASARLYFVEAAARALRNRPGVLLAVGDGPLRAPIAARAQALGLPCQLPGWVDPRQVADYFAATDVGLYPGEDTPYFRAALPLKTLEYLAAGRPVVSSPVDAYHRLGLRGVITAPPTTEGFALGIGAALARGGIAPAALEGFTWRALADRLSDCLHQVLAIAPCTGWPAWHGGPADRRNGAGWAR